ncbi:MAG TPA: choice-of-anchor D domain-containing protein [Verrucomicrobiales bacterium]|nr:choice-of-anchor D domain-containing protein [Verrucomicrobiales bacterium]
MDISFNPTGKDSPPGTTVAKFPGANTATAGLAMLPDGRFLTIGAAMRLAGREVGLARWLPDGTPDPSFGNRGLVRTNITSFVSLAFYAMAVQADGKILAAGTLDGRSVVIRFLPNGAIDSSFGQQGQADLSQSASSSAVLSLAVRSDGRILAGGRLKLGGNGVFDGARLWQLMPDGLPDFSFGTGEGINFPTPNATVKDIAVQPDGKILVSGVAPVSGRPSVWLARCDALGGLDLEFGAAGVVLAPLPAGEGDSEAARLALQSDGKIVTAGAAGPYSGIVVRRFNPNGTPDTSFNAVGTVVTNPSLSNEYVADLCVQFDGKLVLACGMEERFAVMRYQANGTLDSDFGTGGIAGFFPISFGAYPSAMVLQPDGRIVVGGDSWDYISSVGHMVLMRLMDRYSAESLTAEWPVGTLLSDGGTLQWEPTLKGSPPPPEKTITLRNTGTAALTDIAVSLSGPAASAFTVSSAPAVSLNGGASTSLTVGVNAGTEVSDFAAALVIRTGGTDIQEFVIVLRGSTLQPVATMALFEGPQPVAENALVDFGSIEAAQAATRTFTIKNTGNIELQLQGITLGAAGTPGDFTAGPAGTDVITAGASTTFPVTFTPRGPGPRTARLRIASTDTFQLPYEIDLAGALLPDIDAWRQAHFGTVFDEGRAADLSDPDHDGLANLTEYATLTSPVDAGGAPGQYVISNGTFEYTFLRPSLAADFVLYDLEWTNTLQGVWAPAGAPLIILSDDGTKQQVKISAVAGNSSRRFFRLRVTRK